MKGESMEKSRMYPGVKTFNPFVGCGFQCIYCKESFQKLTRESAEKRNSNCTGCLGFLPHEHQERLSRMLPSEKTVFVCGNGDISFARPEFVKRVITRVNQHSLQFPEQEYYFQSKNPACFGQYLNCLSEQKTILVTTLETNRDTDYRNVSKAPLPSKRYEDFKALDWPRKIVTVEPIMDFDPGMFLQWLMDIEPESIWIGYNSRPKSVTLPEPSLSKTLDFIAALREEGLIVKVKDMNR
jgi:uncharacterized Fe-S cluster-containing radical SAM superfamily protein